MERGPGGGGAQVLWAFVARPVRSTRSFFARHWYRRMSVLTVMQHADNAMAFGYGRTLLRGGRWGLRSQLPGGARPPSYLPQANAAARHLPYTALGFLQYVAPTLVLLEAVLLFGEHLAPATLTAFAFIWAGLVVYSVDIWLSARRS